MYLILTRISSKKKKHLATIFFAHGAKNTGKLSELKKFDPIEAATKRKVAGSLKNFQAMLC